MCEGCTVDDSETIVFEKKTRPGSKFRQLCNLMEPAEQQLVFEKRGKQDTPIV